MKHLLMLCLFASTTALAQGAPPPPPAKKDAPPADMKAPPPGGDMKMDMSKMGPWSRKPTNEATTKKEIEAFFKEQEEAEKKGDMAAMTDRVDFPVFMMTDDAKGNVEAKEWNKDQYVAMMKPMVENMPKDMKTKHKPTITVLSDSMVNVTDDFSMEMPKAPKMAGRNQALLIKKDGKWKWKAMTEAGWGGMETPKM